MTEQFPRHGRLAGIDYGHVRIGMAICDPDQKFSSPLTTRHRINPNADADFFRGIAAKEQLVGFVIGLPVHTSGAESAKSAESRRFGKWLGECTGLPFCFFDERYSTVEAGELLNQANLRGKRRKQRLDMLAAQVLLQAFLESPDAASRPVLPLDEEPKSR